MLADRPNAIWMAAALLGVFLTGYYTFRLIFIILFPAHIEENRHGHGNDTHGDRLKDRVMVWPLVVLSAVTLVLGFFGGPIEHFLSFNRVAEAMPAAGHHWLLYVSIGLAAAAVGLAWIEFGRRGAAQVGFVERIPALYWFFSERWYIDRFYRIVLDRVVFRGIAALCAKNDEKVIDGSIDGFGRGTIETGRLIAWLHTGMIQYRLLIIFAVIVLLGAYVAFQAV